MIKTRRILMAEKIEIAVNLKIANKGDKMTTEDIDRQISLQKIHNARQNVRLKTLKRMTNSMPSMVACTLLRN